jgi:hypothetical protein
LLLLEELLEDRIAEPPDEELLELELLKLLLLVERLEEDL